MFLLGVLVVPPAYADSIPIFPAVPDPNIIGFADNATSCGGATLCSSNGTTGYNGTKPFDLSTINSWFQIDFVSGTSLLAGQPAQTMGSGDFLVTNDTGAVVTNFSLTLTDDFTSSTSSVGPCAGLEAGKECDNFQAHDGAANYFSNTGFSGPDLDSCSGGPCVDVAGGSSANFSPGSVTYNWFAGTDAGIPIGATFDVNFASWNNDIGTTTQVSAVPEPASLLLLGSGLGLAAQRLRRRKK